LTDFKEHGHGLTYRALSDRIKVLLIIFVLLMSTLTTITSKNQITIPVKIIRSLGLSPRDKVIVEKGDDTIQIRPFGKRSFLDLYGAIKIKKPVSLKKIKKQFEREMAKKAAL